MAEQPKARRQSQAKRAKPQQKTEAPKNQNGHADDAEGYEEELAGYLQARIKPGLNSGAIPLLARSIAKEIAHQEPFAGASEKPGEEKDEDKDKDKDTDKAKADTDKAEADTDKDKAKADTDEPAEDSKDEPKANAESGDDAGAKSDPQADFEADMHDLQTELGEDWILRFSVQGDDAWLTAEKDDGSQRIEAPTAAVLAEAVGLLNDSGGRSS